MTVVKYSALITELKGKLGGSVFQKCGQSLSLRGNPTRKVSQTSASQSSRVNFANIANTWRGLSDAVHQQWNAVASSYPTFDKFGNSLVLTGYQLFQYLNRVASQNSNPIVTSASTYDPPVDIDIDFDTFSLGGSSWPVLLANDVPAGFAFYIYVTRLFPNARYFANPPYVFGFPVVAGQGSSDNMFSAVMSHWIIAPLVGQVFFWKALKVNLSTANWIEATGASQSIEA